MNSDVHVEGRNTETKTIAIKPQFLGGIDLNQHLKFVFLLFRVTLKQI